MITLSDVQVGGDTVRFRARLRGPQTVARSHPLKHENFETTLLPLLLAVCC